MKQFRLSLPHARTHHSTSEALKAGICLAGVAVLALDEAPAAAGEDGIPDAHCRRTSRIPPVEHGAVLGPGRRLLRARARTPPSSADGDGRRVWRWGLLRSHARGSYFTGLLTAKPLEASLTVATRLINIVYHNG